MRGQYETIAAGEVSPIAVVGAVIRYSFYAVGALALGAVGLGVMSLSNFIPRPVDAPPAFRIAAGEFAGKATSGHVVTSSRLGRAEVLQYGQLYNRTTDLAVALIMPPKGIGMGTQFLQDLTDINLLRLKRPAMMTQTN